MDNGLLEIEALLAEPLSAAVSPPVAEAVVDEVPTLTIEDVPPLEQALDAVDSLIEEAVAVVAQL